MTKILASVLAVAAMAGSAQAWWDVGHGTSGAIAYLKMTDASAKSNLKNILTYVETIYNDVNGGMNWPVGEFGSNVPRTLRPPQNSHNLGNAAIWPDTVKGFYNVKAFDNWHYQNQLYDPEGNGNCNVDGPDAGVLLLVFNDMIRYNGLYNGRDTAHWYQSFSVNMVSHLFGDIMMPFHMMAYCFADGTTDTGGNKWSLTLDNKQGNTISNMHALWDSVGNTWANELQKDVMKNDPDYTKWAQTLLNRPDLQPAFMASTPYGFNYWGNEPTQPVFYDIDFAKDKAAVDNKSNNRFLDRLKVWAHESYNIAAEAYGRFPQGSNVVTGSTDFNWLVKMSEQRIMLAGLRMAAVFDRWLSTDFMGFATPVFAQISTGAGAPPAFDVWSPPAHGNLYLDTTSKKLYKFDRVQGTDGQWGLLENCNGGPPVTSTVTVTVTPTTTPTPTPTPNPTQTRCGQLSLPGFNTAACNNIGLLGTCVVRCFNNGANNSIYQCRKNGNFFVYQGTPPRC